MEDQLFAATRKGLFEFRRHRTGWQVIRPAIPPDFE